MESERRQIFFCTAIGIPTLYIRTETGNRFLRNILKYAKGQRASKRYKNYTRVAVGEYRLALVDYLNTEAADLIEELDARYVLDNLRRRLMEKNHSAAGRLISHTVDSIGSCRTPGRIPADMFNAATENYYRTELKKKHISEGLQVLVEDCADLEKTDNYHLKEVMRNISPDKGCTDYLNSVRQDILDECISAESVRKLLHLCLGVVYYEKNNNYKEI